MAHLPLTIKELSIENANFGAEFVEALIQQVGKFKNLEKLRISNTYVSDEKGIWNTLVRLVGGKKGDEKGGQEAGVRLAKVLATNATIKELYLWYTDLIGSDNVEEW